MPEKKSYIIVILMLMFLGMLASCSDSKPLPKVQIQLPDGEQYLVALQEPQQVVAVGDSVMVEVREEHYSSKDGLSMTIMPAIIAEDRTDYTGSYVTTKYTRAKVIKVF